MRSATVENRLRRLEESPRFSPLARASDEELEAMIFQNLNILAADHPTYDALVDELAASPDPEEQDCAKGVRAFLADYLTRHQPEAAP